MSDGGFDVDLGEITAHAKQVEGTYSELKTAYEAARQRMDEGGFGLLGQPLALWCNNTMSDATDTLQAAVEAGERHVATLHTWAERKHVDEEAVQALMKKANPGG
ncbi:hypothetical protein [Amycolatopsis nigrescens]|uniref:hypothetical protein n=1 Tax=Amycolatopsis nigrescens TaxID=381445 RepID=UPI0003676F5E|nr:hypothetical protein [Amycolatopsis nigrescens]